jgi:type VI secretion system protein ImpJ
MKIYRPLWEDGAALAPQQFQQQARWSEHVASMVARMGISHPWGVIAAEFDDAALALSRLNATRLVVRFQDGTLVDTNLADNLPPVCDVSIAASSGAVDVVVALPLMSASGGNLDNGQDSERPRRWKAERVVAQELAGHESGELAILRHALTLRLSSQENTAYLICPVTLLAVNDE